MRHSWVTSDSAVHPQLGRALQRVIGSVAGGKALVGKGERNLDLQLERDLGLCVPVPEWRYSSLSDPGLGSSRHSSGFTWTVSQMILDCLLLTASIQGWMNFSPLGSLEFETTETEPSLYL